MGLAPGPVPQPGRHLDVGPAAGPVLVAELETELGPEPALGLGKKPEPGLQAPESGSILGIRPEPGPQAPEPGLILGWLILG